MLGRVGLGQYEDVLLCADPSRKRCQGKVRVEVRNTSVFEDNLVQLTRRVLEMQMALPIVRCFLPRWVGLNNAGSHPIHRGFRPEGQVEYHFLVVRKGRD